MDDEFVQDRYEQEVRGERNARISDADKYVQLPDITVQSAAKAKRAQLTDQDRQELLDYRQALKDLPDQPGFLLSATRISGCFGL
ncbi:MAG: phage tail assembly chaperone [Parasutterella sp.]